MVNEYFAEQFGGCWYEITNMDIQYMLKKPRDLQ